MAAPTVQGLSGGPSQAALVPEATPPSGCVLVAHAQQCRHPVHMQQQTSAQHPREASMSNSQAGCAPAAAPTAVHAQAENVVTDARAAPETAQHVQHAYERLAKALRALPEVALDEAAAASLLAAMDLAPQVPQQLLRNLLIMVPSHSQQCACCALVHACAGGLE